MVIGLLNNQFEMSSEYRLKVIQFKNTKGNDFKKVIGNAVLFYVCFCNFPQFFLTIMNDDNGRTICKCFFNIFFHKLNRFYHRVITDLPIVFSLCLNVSENVYTVFIEMVQRHFFHFLWFDF